ncbi:MAG: hypothetical protein HQ523_05065, partial [Lentisphaerae bacterium]|nr:hypothetical protein [Lentisphaerota bacterium]
PKITGVPCLLKKTQNIVLVALMSVLALVFAISAFLLFRGISQFSKEEKTLKRSVATLRNYYARNPFPSKENVEREKANGVDLQRWLGELSESLREGQVEPIQITPSIFKGLFSQKRDQLKILAKDHKVTVPDGFAFGFERYSAGGALPAPSDVPRLAQQLMIADQLCRVLFESGASAVTQLRREEFDSAGVAEVGQVGRPNRPNRSSRARPSVARAASSIVNRPWTVTGDAGELKGSDLSARLRFGLTFEAREEALMKVLNQLAAHEMFVVVTLLQIEKESDDVVEPQSALGTVAEDNVMAGGSKHPPRSQRLMSGIALEQPMSVSMEVDVYRFAELTSGKGA